MSLLFLLRKTREWTQGDLARESGRSGADRPHRKRRSPDAAPASRTLDEDRRRVRPDRRPIGALTDHPLPEPDPQERRRLGHSCARAQEAATPGAGRHVPGDSRKPVGVEIPSDILLILSTAYVTPKGGFGPRNHRGAGRWARTRRAGTAGRRTNRCIAGPSTLEGTAQRAALDAAPNRGGWRELRGSNASKKIRRVETWDAGPAGRRPTGARGVLMRFEKVDKDTGEILSWWSVALQGVLGKARYARPEAMIVDGVGTHVADACLDCGLPYSHRRHRPAGTICVPAARRMPMARSRATSPALMILISRRVGAGGSNDAG